MNNILDLFCDKNKCKICGELFSTKGGVIGHIEKEHKDRISLLTKAVESVINIRDLNDLRNSVTDLVCEKKPNLNKEEVRSVIDDFIASRMEQASNVDFESFCEDVEYKLNI